VTSQDERLEASAKLSDEAAAQLEQALAHCRTAAQHFRDHEIPRAAAHAWAVRGHLLEAQERLDRQAREHAERSVP
jgi:hypothetical protein